jgi:L-alanine-DL-glutamate epimerase-like enolase superfamily enzyme
MPADILHFLRGDCIIQEPLDVQDGEVMVPQRAGLGIALDDDKIAAYRIEET